MLFPKKRTKRSFMDLCVLIYGNPKSGKTTLAYEMGEYFGKPALFIASEDGFGAVDASIVRVSSKAGLEKLAYHLESNIDQIREEHSCIVFDLISEIDQMVADWVCETCSVTSLSDLEFGKGYTLHLNEFKKIIMRFLALGLPVKFISHVKERKFKENGADIVIQTPDFTTKNARNFILGKCDAIGFLYSMGKDDMRLTFVPSLANDAGSRFDEIVDEYAFVHTNPGAMFKRIEGDFNGDRNDK